MLNTQPIQAKQQNGLSLIELLISITVGLFLVAGILGVYTNSVRSSADTIKSAKLNQELRAVMNLMVADLRRAGYWSNAVATIGALTTTPNYFTEAATDIRLGKYSAAVADNSCILYTYDLNEDTFVGMGTGVTITDATKQNNANMERFGFRLTPAGSVEVRTGGSPFSCAATDGTWESVTNPNIVNVTALQFTQVNTNCLNVTSGDSWQSSCSDTTFTGPPAYVAPTAGDVMVESRQINISITGELYGDSSVSMSTVESVKVRNDRTYAAP